jgi:hypothetical protein
MVPDCSGLAAVGGRFWLIRLGEVPAWDLSRAIRFEPDLLSPQE